MTFNQDKVLEVKDLKNSQLVKIALENFKDVAVNRMFWIAAEQSWIQKSLSFWVNVRSLLPHTTIVNVELKS